MQVPPSPMPPVPISRVPLWTAIITAVIIVIHFVYNFAASTGTLPQNSVALINYVLIGAELILIIYLIAKKRYIAFLLLALIALNAYFGFRVVKFTVTKTASEKALEGDITATKNLSPSEGLKVLNQEASRINQLNIQSGKLWNAPSPDFSNMNNEQFQTFLQELLDTYEEKKQVVEAFRSDYDKYKEYIDANPGDTPGFDKMYAWDFVSAEALDCYNAQYNTQVPIIKNSQKINYDLLTPEKKSTYYEDVFYPGVIESDKVCRNF